MTVPRLLHCSFGIGFCRVAVGVSLGFMNMGFGFVHCLIGLFGSGRLDVVARFFGRLGDCFPGFFSGWDCLRMSGSGEQGGQYQREIKRSFHNGVPLVLRWLLVRGQYRRFH
jgi:hypothetical protein